MASPTAPNSSASPITHVMDTAMWVATFRARENERPDGLFKDPFVKFLTGDQGEALVERMEGSGTVEWSVVIRTVIIDQFIQEAIKGGVDVIVNLGTGLDTRPYRMQLPADLLWIEADFPKTITFKTERLAAHLPVCKLERYSVDLSDDKARLDFLKSVEPRGKKILALTEGVLPYLSSENVGKLAKDLHDQTHIEYWIAEYLSPMMWKLGLRKNLDKQLKNAPFIFRPDDWFGFFLKFGWRVAELKYTFEEGAKYKRFPPYNFWMLLRFIFTSAKSKEEMRKMAGYALFKRGNR